MTGCCREFYYEVMAWAEARGPLAIELVERYPPWFGYELSDGRACFIAGYNEDLLVSLIIMIDDTNGYQSEGHDINELFHTTPEIQQ